MNPKPEPEPGGFYGVRTQEKSCSSDLRFRRKLSGTTGYRLPGTGTVL